MNVLKVFVYFGLVIITAAGLAMIILSGTIPITGAITLRILGVGCAGYGSGLLSGLLISDTKFGTELRGENQQ